jgi:hypothetical protein
MDVIEKEVPLWADRVGGEKGRSTLYLPDEALELTDSVRLLDEAGLTRSALCCFALSIPFVSYGVRLPDPRSRISGASCKRLGDIVRDRLPSDVPVRELNRRCCTFATIAGLSKSYCCTVS